MVMEWLGMGADWQEGMRRGQEMEVIGLRGPGIERSTRNKKGGIPRVMVSLGEGGCVMVDVDIHNSGCNGDGRCVQRAGLRGRRQLVREKENIRG